MTSWLHVGTTWRALSKPPQRRQGTDLPPLWLFCGTLSANRPKLASSCRVCSYCKWPSKVSPQSLCNRSFWWHFCVVTLPVWHFCWYRGLCHRSKSDLFFLFPRIRQGRSLIIQSACCNSKLNGLLSLHLKLKRLKNVQLLIYNSVKVRFVLGIRPKIPIHKCPLSVL